MREALRPGHRQAGRLACLPGDDAGLHRMREGEGESPVSLVLRLSGCVARFERAVRKDMKDMHDQYPRGKLNADDEGQLAIAITTKDKTVIVDFGKGVTWLGLGAEEAR